jgi:hypothetical protein
MNTRVFVAIEARNRNQGAWIAIAATGHMDLGTVDKELRAVGVGCIVDADVLDSEQIRAVRQGWGQLEGVAQKACDWRGQELVSTLGSLPIQNSCLKRIKAEP